MKRLIVLIIGLLILTATNAFAFIVPPHNRHFITDTTGTLNQSQLDQLDSKMEAIDRDKHNQIVALMTASLGGEDIKDVAQQVFDSWKPGYEGKDNGVLILVAVNDHKMRIQTGKGVEGDLPDVSCWHIIDGVMKPKFKARDFFGGMSAAVDAINSSIESRRTTNKSVAATDSPTTTEISASRSNGAMGMLFGGIFVVGLLGIIMTAIYINNRNEEKERIERERLRIEREHLYNMRQQNVVRPNTYRAPFVSPPKPDPVINYDAFVEPITKPKTAAVIGGVAAVGVVGAAAASIAIAEERRRREEREEEERRERRRRDDEEEDRRRRQREEDDERSQSSSSSSSDSSSSGGFDSGGGSSSGGGSDGGW